jgi:hypothetical protein
MVFEAVPIFRGSPFTGMGVEFVFHGTILGYPRLKAFSVSAAGSLAIEKGVKGYQGQIHESESSQRSNREF